MKESADDEVEQYQTTSNANAHSKYSKPGKLLLIFY